MTDVCGKGAQPTECAQRRMVATIASKLVYFTAGYARLPLLLSYSSDISLATLDILAR